MPHAIKIALTVLAAPAVATLANLSALMEKQEGLVLELASEVEAQHALRCGLTVSDCQEMSQAVPTPRTARRCQSRMRERAKAPVGRSRPCASTR